MKICQIATIGENIEWIIKGVTSSKVDKLILISTNETHFLEKIKDIKERLLDPNFEMNPIEISEEIIESRDILKFIKVLKEIILECNKNDYFVEINATAGLRIWQLLGYFTAIQLNGYVKNFFIIDKQNGLNLNLPLVILGKTEEIILDIIKDEMKNIEQIKKSYEIYKKKDVSYGLIWKYITKLKEKNLVNVYIRDKHKFFESSDLGKIYQNSLSS